MFEKLKYKRIAKEYFRPSESNLVSLDNLIKILKGDVFNPIRLEDPESSCDYAFMVVGVDESSPINSWAGREWGSNSYEIAQKEANWYGKFTAEGPSRLIIPPKTIAKFHYKSDSPLNTKIHISEFENEPWRFGGFMQIDKDSFYKTLVSNITAKKVADTIKQVYQGQKNVRFDLLDIIK